MCQASSKKLREFPARSLSRVWGHGSFTGWKRAGMWHREYGSFPKAATKRSLKGTDVTRVKSYVRLPFSLYTMMNCILFPSLVLGFNHFAEQTWIKILSGFSLVTILFIGATCQIIAVCHFFAPWAFQIFHRLSHLLGILVQSPLLLPLKGNCLSGLVAFPEDV